MLAAPLPSCANESSLLEEGPALQALRAIVRMAVRFDPALRAALLVLENDGLIVAVDHNLNPEDRFRLWDLRREQTASSMIRWGKENDAFVRPLLTEAGEVIGAFVLFEAHSDNPNAANGQAFEEMCCIATLAIEQKHLSEDLVYRAHRDQLTQLWNRTRMEEEIDRVLAEGRTLVGLVVVGIDRFRVINDVLGYQVGNELLRQVAARIANVLDPSFSLARTGGDEFMVLMPDLPMAESAALRAQWLLDCFSLPFQIGDHELVIRATAGASVGLAEMSSAADLQTQASTALRYAKTRTRGRAAIFDPSMLRVPPERLVMEQHLRFALQKREFVLHYQPQIDLRTGRLTGVEALLRWNHPALGFISPGIFVPLAEEIGLVEDIGDWVIEEALRQLQTWRAQGMDGIRIAVNVSPLQFARMNFAAVVAQKLRNARAAAADLELEITESAVMSNLEHALRQMKMLRSLGIQLALDDFGTGHSSLAYLRTLPLNRLKIDRMFVRDVEEPTERPPLLASIVQMSHALELEAIVEGVETSAQLAVVRAMGCEEVQGFCFSKPMPPDELLQWGKQRAALPEAAVGSLLI